MDLFFSRLLRQFPPTAPTMRADRRERDAYQARREQRIALIWGAACHLAFAAGVSAMIVNMGFGMQLGLGPFSGPLAWIINTALIAQFALVHSALLTARGRKLLTALAPAGTGKTLMTTTYGAIVSVQLIALYVFWSPTGTIWWQAQGWVLVGMLVLYGFAWLLLAKSIWDGGLELQSGMLGWLALWRGTSPQFPDMPERGSFKLVRQPIYVSFALTPWLTPTWTPDQLFIATGLTAYCVLAPLHKEKRFAAMFGERWHVYRARTPYFLPFLKGRS